MSNTLFFAALVLMPSLCAYALPTVGRWLWGKTGMRIGAAVILPVILVPFMGALLTFLLMASQGSLLAPQTGDETLGLVLSALVTVGTLAGLGTLALTWNWHAKSLQS